MPYSMLWYSGLYRLSIFINFLKLPLIVTQHEKTGLVYTKYGTAHLQGNECTRETHSQLSSNSRAKLLAVEYPAESQIIGLVNM